MNNYSIRDAKLKIHGRIDNTLSTIPLLSNGQGIEANVTGTQLWVDVEADYEDYEPWAAIEVNGELVSRFMIDRGSHRICLFRGRGQEGVTRVKFYRELQAMSEDKKTCIVIHGLWTDGEFLDPPEYDIKLEFIGDSISSGEGTYGARSDFDWIASCMSYSRTYINLIGHSLNAECRVISQGGWGVFSGWDNDRRHAIPGIYEQVCGLAAGSGDKYGAGKAYDFASWVPDAVLINLGTNDREGFNQPPFKDPDTGEIYKMNTNPDGSFADEDTELIKSAVVDFLKMIRRNNPVSHIIWLYGMLGYDLSLILADAINRYKAETADDDVAYLQLPTTNEKTVGSNGHPGYEAHKIAAEILVDYLNEHI
jgi:hypothetical protein